MPNSAPIRTAIYVRNLPDDQDPEQKLQAELVQFPPEYALYRISVSPVSHSCASRNPELEAAFQYQQIYLETVLN